MLLAICAAVLSAAACLGGTAAVEPEVRVRQCADGPGLFIDGRRTVPWMFSCRDGTRSRPVSNGWTRCSFRVRPDSDRARCQFHLRCAFPAKRGFIRYRNFSVTSNGVEMLGFRKAFDDEKSLAAHWRMWPTPQMTGWTNYLDHGEWVQEVGPVEDVKARGNYVPNSRRFDLAKGVVYDVSFEVRSDVVEWIQPNLYSVDTTGVHYCPVMMDSDDFLSNQVKMAAAAGVDIVSYLYEGSWIGPGDDYDFTELDAISDRILRANPRALLVPRFGVDAPGGWLEAHPEARMRYDSPSGQVSRLPSVAHPGYRAAACRYVRAVAGHMRARYPRSFAGMHINGQHTHEWFYYDSPTRFHGYDPATLESFGEDPPTVAERSAREPWGLVNSGPSARRVFRFNRHLQNCMADFLAQLAHAAREATDGKKLVIMFYGYAFELASMGTAAANSGHYGLQRLVDMSAGDIDMMAAPIPYGDRGWTGISAEMGSTDTLLRAGILPMDENDTRTHLDRVTPRRLAARQQTCDVVTRELTQGVFRNVGCWFFDLNGRGWWEDPELWRCMSEIRPLAEDAYAAMRPVSPEVALVNDEDSILRMSARVPGATGGWAFITEPRLRPAQAGFSSGFYLCSDIARRPIGAKLQVFLSSWGISDENLERMVRQRSTNPATRVWVWAPGWIADDGTTGTGRMDRLTGFRFRRVARSVEERERFEPLFTVEEGSGVEVWSRWKDGSPRVAIRRDGGGWSVFMGRPEFRTPAMLRRLAALAGVHSCLPDGETGKANAWNRDSRVLVQAVTNGQVKVAMPDGTEKTLAMRTGQCAVLDAGCSARMSDASGAGLPAYREDDWCAGWVWTGAPGGERWFRRTFICDPATLTKAAVQFAADDRAEVQVNGRRVGAVCSWAKPTVADTVLPLLRNGENAIQVKASNTGSSAGLMCELDLVGKDGNVVKIGTGGDWEAATSPDGPWRPAREFMRLPQPPYGETPYMDFRNGRELKTDAFSPGEPPPPSPPLETAIRRRDGAMRYYENGVEKPFISYRTPSAGVHRQSRFQFLSGFDAAGVGLAEISLPFGMRCIKSDGAVDTAAIEREIVSALHFTSNMNVICFFNVDAPAWYVKAHPEGRFAFSDGRVIDRMSFADENYRRDMAAALARAVEFLKTRPYYGRIAGFGLDGGFDGQFMQWTDHGYRSMGDYSAPMRKLFGGDPPDAARRRGGANDIYLDPVKDADVLAYNRLFGSASADFLLACARAIKEASDRRKIVGAYYGKFFSIAGYLETGELAIRKVLDSPDVDYLVAVEYHQRPAGSPHSLSAPTGSYTMHSKMFMDEADIRTFLDGQKNWGYAGDAKGTESMIRKMFAQSFTRGHAIHWYDLFGGWYEHPAIRETIASVQRIASRHCGDPVTPAEMAVVCDEESFMHAKSAIKSETARGLLHFQNGALGRIGAPFDVYFADDLAAAPRYRFYVFLFCFAPSAAGRSAIAAAKASGAGWMEVNPGEKAPSPSEYREAARAAGVAIISGHDDVMVCTGRGLLSVHAGSSGRKTLHWPRTATFRDAVTGERVAENVKEISIDMRMGETRLLDVEGW